MKRSLMFIALLMLLSTAHAQNSVQAQFQAEHDRQVKAFNRKDLGAFMTHYTPDLTVHSLDGKTMDLAGWRGFIQTILPSVRHIVTHHHRVAKVTPEGKEYRARIEEAEAYDIVDTSAMFGKKDARHHLTIDSVYEETWTQTAAGWKVRDLRFVSEKQMLDHKPVVGG